MFFFIFFINIFEVIPVIQMPGNARIAVPLFLAVTVWFIYNIVGIKHQGFGHYMKNSLVPPGVPKALLILVVPIEFVSTFLVRPFSLAIRLFANMLAGHFILVTFALLCADAVRGVGHRGPAAVHLRPPRRPDRFRGPRRRPAGVHLHDPHRRVHRRFHAPEH